MISYCLRVPKGIKIYQVHYPSFCYISDFDSFHTLIIKIKGGFKTVCDQMQMEII